MPKAFPVLHSDYRRWLPAAVLVVAGLGGVALAGRLFLPGMAERRLVAALADAGYTQAQVTVRRAGWGWAEAGIRLAPGLEVETARLDFAGWLPWGDELASLALSNVNLDAARQGSTALARLSALPARRLELTGLQMAVGDWSLPLDLHAVLDHGDGAGWRGHATLTPPSGLIPAALSHGTLPPLDVDVTVTDTGVRLDGAALSGTLTLAGDGAKADVTAKGWHVADALGPLSGSLAWQGAPGRWSVTLTADTPSSHLSLDSGGPWMDAGVTAAVWGLRAKVVGAGDWAGQGTLALNRPAPGAPLAFTLSANDATAAELPLMAAFLSLSGRLDGDADRGWRVDLAGPAQIGGRLRDGQGTPISLGWDPGADGHLGINWRDGRGHADLQGAVVGRWGPASAPLVAGGSTDLRATADWDGAGMVALDATATALEAPSLLGARLEGARLSADVDRANRAAPWRVTLDQGRLQIPGLAPLALALSVTGDPVAAMTLSGQAKGVGTPLSLGLSGQWDGAKVKGDATVALSPLSLADVPDLGTLLPGIPGPVRGDGTVTGSLRLTLVHRDLEGSGDLRLDDVSLAAPNLTVQGLNGQLALDSLFPLHSPPGQHLSAKTVRAGFTVGDVGLDLQVAGGQLVLQGGDLAWAGGHAHLTPEGNGGFGADVSGVDLAQALPRWTAAGYGLTGTLAGRLLGRFDGLTPVITFGALAADKPGRIAYAAGDAGEAGLPVVLNPAHNGNVALITRALADFDYQALSLLPTGPVGPDLRARLLVRGVNAGFYGGYPVDLDLELDGGDLLPPTAATGTR
ncbi:MAG: YdbH domain-containing protein [Azospirillaceae bacterium]|nr:YdbH domain-containing protein [Azospirillaceae bacterium]